MAGIHANWQFCAGIQINHEKIYIDLKTISHIMLSDNVSRGVLEGVMITMESQGMNGTFFERVSKYEQREEQSIEKIHLVGVFGG